MKERENIMSRTYLYLALALAMLLPGCAGRYGKPAADPPPNLYTRTGMSDGTMTIGELVEFGPSFPFRHRPKGIGQLTISPERIGWNNADDEDRSFSIRPTAVKSVTMKCVVRAGGNVCLEMAIQTITGLTYHFRDIEWAGGYNQRIRHARNQLAQSFPRVVFAEKTVDEIN